MKSKIKWSKRMLKAVAGSVRKWERVVDGGVDKGFADCPLCHLYLSSDQKRYCKSCPIAITSGVWGCNITPYEEWGVFADLAPWPKKHLYHNDNPKAIAAAKAMLAFLRKLERQGKKELGI